MQAKPLFAALVAAAIAFPLAADAGGTGKHKPASANGGNDGGAEAMFKSMDKDGDGVITKAEALGTPHHPDFAKLDRNGDGKLTREEHAAAPEHIAAAKSKDVPASNPGGRGSASGEKKMSQ